MNRFIYLVILSFLCASYTNVESKNPFSFQKKGKKEGVIKSHENKDLKMELIDLEESFKSDYELIKSNYRDKISALKEMQKSEVTTLKKGYKNRRRAIYKKYGVKPPKKESGSGFDNSDIFKPNKKDKRVSPVRKTK